jgi:hypothetical protein
MRTQFYVCNTTNLNKYTHTQGDRHIQKFVHIGSVFRHSGTYAIHKGTEKCVYMETGTRRRDTHMQWEEKRRDTETGNHRYHHMVPASLLRAKTRKQLITQGKDRSFRASH